MREAGSGAGGFGSLRLAKCIALAAPQLGELAQDHTPLDYRNMIDKEYTFQMVHLMLQANCLDALGLHLTNFTFQIEKPEPNGVGALDFGVMIRQR